MPRPSRRRFLKHSLTLATTLPLAPSGLARAFSQVASLPRRRATESVAIARCRTYADAEVHAAPRNCFDLIGGIGPLVNGKTATVKLNLTGQDFSR
jgi:hypothetical protein